MYILVVDDDAGSRGSVAKFLRDMGHDVVECDNGEKAVEMFHSGDFPMVLSDIKMPRMDGMELLKLLKDSPRGAETDIVLFTGHGTMESAIDALRLGAYDYLLKPVNIEELAALTERIAEHQALRRENRVLTEQFTQEVEAATEETRREIARLKKMAAKSVGLEGLGFYSETMRELVQHAEKYHTDRTIPVLIQGETGTGKEVIARLVHYGSFENDAPFVDINCAAITPNLFESELFGYEAGSFTGGLSKGQKGKIDLAMGGTLFLDEVGEIPLDLQGKLLRMIQEKEFYRVGGLRKIKTDVRIICATNIDLEKAVAQGNFRKDLYYRLKVGHIYIPPLRKRKEDIIPLAIQFLQEFAKQKGKNFKSISDGAGKIMLSHDWPGNVRELRNAIEWAVFMYDGEALLPQHLNILSVGKAAEATYSEAEVKDVDIFTLPKNHFELESHIDSLVCEALRMHKGNKTATAQYLGISRRALCYRLEQIEGGRKKEAE